MRGGLHGASSDCGQAIRLFGMDHWAPQSLKDLAGLTVTVRECICDSLGKTADDTRWTDWRTWVETQLVRAVDRDWLADGLAQTMVWGELAARLAAESMAEGEGPEAATPDEQGRAANTLRLLRRRLCALVPVFVHGPFVDLMGRVQQVDLETVDGAGFH